MRSRRVGSGIEMVADVYSTTLCLLHRAHMPPAMTGGHGGDITTTNSAIDDSSYPSRNIAFRAAHAITSIVENLVEHDELKYCPAFIVYSLFSALIMHVYQMRSSIPGVVAETKERMRKCMDALRDVSRIWIVAKMVYTLFESILGNKALEERLQKSAGRRHHHHHSSSSRRANNTHQHSHQHRVPLDLSAPTAEPPKRKFDDMDLSGGALSGPVPTMSYERSRPQTPATTPGGAPPPPLSGLPGSSGGGGGPGATTPSTNSTSNPHASPYPPVLGGSSSNGNGALPPPSSGLNSRGATRPPTPFNGAGPTMSVPATPPDLYLVTRSSPPISQSLWENFQPNQLFPDDSGLAYLSPPAGPGGGGGGEGGGGFPPPFSDYGGVSGSSPTQRHAAVVGVGAGGQPWPNQFEINDAAAGMGSSPDDTWSNSSKGGIVPTTLNVEDWYVSTPSIPSPPLFSLFFLLAWPEVQWCAMLHGEMRAGLDWLTDCNAGLTSLVCTASLRPGLRKAGEGRAGPGSACGRLMGRCVHTYILVVIVLRGDAMLSSSPVLVSVRCGVSMAHMRVCA